MKSERSSNGGPFRCYVGRMVSFGQRPHVVESYEVHDHRLMFRLRPVGEGTPTRVTVLELLELMDQRGA